MKRILPYFLLLSIWQPTFAANVQKDVDQLINKIDPSINIGVSIFDLNTGATLYQRNPQRLFTPASNMKLFSNAAALIALGPDYRFKTSLSASSGTIENGVLKGSLYLILPGDPSFSQADLKGLLSELNNWGIKEIAGDVIVVSNNRTVAPHPPGFVNSDMKYSYGASVAPVVLDENCLTVTVNPGQKEGQPVVVELGQENASIVINNLAKTKNNGAKCGVGVNLNQNNQMTVGGCMGVGQWAVQQRIAIQNPMRYLEEAVKLQLTNLHINLAGKVVLGAAPKGALLLATHESEPISQLMAETLKPSDNLYADSLFLHVAAKLSGTPLNWTEAQPVVKNFIQQQTGINMQNAVLIDGSGLSLYDKLTTEQTVGLLRYLHDCFPLAYEYIAALPVAGFDGTLQKRFRKPSEQGLMRAKTGTMTGILSLSGYIYSANAHTLAFSIFINKTKGTKPSVSGRYRSLIEILCDYFLQHKPGHFMFASPANPHARVAFQQKPSRADGLRNNTSKWRRLEYAVKQALRGQDVAVIYRGNELIINDNNSDQNKVWSSLKNVRSRYPFAAAVITNTAISTSAEGPVLLLVKSSDNSTRVWKIRELVM